MSFSDALTIIGIAASCLIALIGGIYGIVSDTKKFELAEAYKKELFSWYCEVLSIITRMEAQPSETDALLLGRFSALIDIGRFYFPNDIYRKPEIGRTRPRIYWGYRQLPLDFLVLIYEIAKSGNMERETDVVQYLKGEYSSAVF